jgi:predicted nucleotide-binding protein (sugar kinase/HSP70/actin superfamily)
MYYPFWKTFFESLGHEVIESSVTTRAIMDKGVKNTVSDACIPIKIYHGHVDDLMDKVDYIFVPRLVSMRKYGDFGTETLCPKFLGLPDMITASFTRAVPMLEIRIDLKKGPLELFRVYRDLGDKLSASRWQIYKAYGAAWRKQRRYEGKLKNGIRPLDALQQVLGGQQPNTPAIAALGALKIAVVGYPYAIYDDYVNVGLMGLLAKEGVQVKTQDMLSHQQLDRQSSKLAKDMFWYFSNRAVQGALHFMDVEPVDGLIHITAFACGPDSIVDKFLEIEAKRRKMPYMAITIDEHTGEAGIRTRMEAFLDMLQYRREQGEI